MLYASFEITMSYIAHFRLQHNRQTQRRQPNIAGHVIACGRQSFMNCIVFTHAAVYAKCTAVYARVSLRQSNHISLVQLTYNRCKAACIHLLV